MRSTQSRGPLLGGVIKRVFVQKVGAPLNLDSWPALLRERRRERHVCSTKLPWAQDANQAHRGGGLPKEGCRSN